MSGSLSRIARVGALATALVLSGCSGSSGSGAKVASGCKPAHTFNTVSSKKLTISAPDFAPFVSKKDNTQSGIDVDVINQIAAMECLSTNFLQVDYSGAIPAVQSKRADVAIGDYYRTTSRAEVVGLSKAMYVDGMGLVSKDGVKDIPTVITHNVGTVDGYLWVNDMKKLMGDKLKIYKSNVEMFADLKAGRIDVGIDSVPAAQFQADQNKDAGLQVATANPDDQVGASVKPAQVGIPYTKDNADLGKALDDDIATLRGNGKLDQIFTDHNVDTSLTKLDGDYLVQS